MKDRLAGEAVFFPFTRTLHCLRRLYTIQSDCIILSRAHRYTVLKALGGIYIHVTSCGISLCANSTATDFTTAAAAAAAAAAVTSAVMRQLMHVKQSRENDSRLNC